MSVYIAPADRPDILFGDVFSALWFHDVFLREDATPLGPTSGKGGTQQYIAVPPALSRASRDLLLAHGRPCQAVVLSDDCEIESILVRKKGQGRLLFAAIMPWTEEPARAESNLHSGAFYRHPLAPGPGYSGGLVEMRRLFMVDGRAVSGGGRIACLGDEPRARLEHRWAAFAGRRGPIAHLRGAEKVAKIIDAAGDATRLDALDHGIAQPAQAARDASLPVAHALSQAWELEGRFVNGADDAHEKVSDGRDLAGELARSLRELSRLAEEAAARLELVLA